MNPSAFAALLLQGQMQRLDPATVYPDDTAEPAPFKQHYDTHILPRVRVFEERRLAALRTFRGRCFVAGPAIAAVVIVALAMLAAFGGGDVAEFILFGAVAAIMAIIAFAAAPVYGYKASVKGEVFPQIFSFFGPDFAYEPTGSLRVSSLKPSKIVPSHDNETTEDYVRGAYRGVSIELTEAKLTEQRGSGKNRKTVTVFRGVFVRLGMNKRFKGQTIVRADRGRIGNWFSSAPSGMEVVRLEDPIFEDKFEVYSTDQIEARYLLTTSFMERLLNLGRIVRSDQIECSFYEDRLLLKFESSHDRFETSSIFQPATFVDDVRTIKEEMQEIFGIIDTLKLDQRTGL